MTSKLHAPLTSLRELKSRSLIFAQMNALPASACADIIRRFEAAEDDMHPGRIGQRQNLNQSIKRSTDIYISGKPHWQDTDKLLHRSLAFAMNELRVAFPYFGGAFKDLGYNLQRTKPGEYYHWHIDGGSHEFSERQLVAIWYLNDVDGPGGETKFFAQDVTVKPECGKLILFPPFWTHEHCGVTLQEGVKYIATTWIVFA